MNNSENNICGCCDTCGNYRRRGRTYWCIARKKIVGLYRKCKLWEPPNYEEVKDESETEG